MVARGFSGVSTESAELLSLRARVASLEAALADRGMAAWLAGQAVGAPAAKTKGVASKAARRIRAVESFQAAAETIGVIEPGVSLFAVTRGQFSMIDAVLHVLDQVGPARVTLWTWTIADYEIDVFRRLLGDGRITGGLLVIDHGARTKNHALIAEWIGAFGVGSVRYVVNHAKIATVETDGMRVLLRGSMNLNANSRFEQLDITEGGPEFGLVARLEAELSPDVRTGADAYRSSKCGPTAGVTLALPFTDLKTWRPK